MKLTRSEIEGCVRYAQACLADSAIPNIHADVIDAAADEVVRDFVAMAANARPLSPGERGIVSLVKPKSAALLADRVWSTSDEHVPDPDITFGWEAQSEARIGAAFALQKFYTARDEHRMSPAQLGEFVHSIERTLANDLRRTTGASVAPLYGSVASRDVQYRSGDTAAIVAVIDNLAIVAEEHLTWDQVADFRRDTEARFAYRAFVHWLDAEMVGRSITYISDDIGVRVERYQWALRKHGLQTVIGTLASTINPKYLLGASGVAVAIETIEKQPFWSLVAAGGILVGHAALSLATVLLERQDLELAHREVAYVAEVSVRFLGPGTTELTG